MPLPITIRKNTFHRAARLTILMMAVAFLPAAFAFAGDAAPQVVKVEGDVEYTHDPSIAKDAPRDEYERWKPVIKLSGATE